MKKFLKIAFINILLLIIILIIGEFIAFLTVAKDFNKYLCRYNIQSEKLNYSSFLNSADANMEYVIQNEMRKPTGLNYKKNPIVLFGCSYTYGTGLEEYQTVARKISDLTQRPVYNRGLEAKGIQHMYWQLKSNQFYKDIANEPDYIIYFYSPNLHTIRLYEYTFQLFDDFWNLRYYPNKTDKNGNLIDKKPYLPQKLSGLYLIKYFEHFRATQFARNSKNNPAIENLTELIFKKSKEEAEKHYPKCKFVIFCFNTEKNEINEHNIFLDKLEKDGFTVIKMNEFTQKDIASVKEWQISDDDPHPNEKYWDFIAPQIVKKLNL